MIDAQVQPLRYCNQDVLTFKQLDRLNGVAKGVSFRAFKRALPSLQEGVHFMVLDADEQSALIAELIASGRLYPHTRNAVLITREGYRLMQRPE